MVSRTFRKLGSANHGSSGAGEGVKKREWISFLFMFAVVDPSLDLADLFGDRNLLGTDLGALPERLATPGPIFLIEHGDPLCCGFISRIEEISKGPNQSRRSQIAGGFLVLIHRARGRAARTENAPDGSLKYMLFFRRLFPLLIRCWLFRYQVGLDRIVLFKEEGRDPQSDL